MKDKIVIYQKPTCSKCRATVSLLEESGEKFETVNYYEALLTVDKLRELTQKLGVSIRDILRNDEPAARTLATATDEEIINAMAQNPDLIQQLIVVRGNKVKVCRPPENVLDLLK